MSSTHHKRLKATRYHLPLTHLNFLQLRPVLEHRRQDRSEIIEAAASDRGRETWRRQHQVHEMGRWKADR